MHTVTTIGLDIAKSVVHGVMRKANGHPPSVEARCLGVLSEVNVAGRHRSMCLCITGRPIDDP
jgi:hypothetical protein